MKKHLFFSAIIALLLSSCLEGQVHHKDLPWDFYPPEYEQLGPADWPQMMQTLNIALAGTDLDSLRRNSDLRMQVSFTLARTAKINWDGGRRPAVSAYLQRFYQTLSGGGGYLRTIPEEQVAEGLFPNSDLIYAPHKALWALLFVDEDAACRLIEERWASSYQAPERNYHRFWRAVLLDGMQEKFASARVAACIERLAELSQENASPREQRRLQQFRLKHVFHLLNDERQAWGYLLQQSPLPQGLASVRTAEVAVRWYDQLLAMRAVFGQPDFSIPLELAGSRSNPVEQYLLLYSSCFLLNNRIFRQALAAPETARAEQLAAQVVQFIATHPLPPAAAGEIDFLAGSYQTFQRRINER